MNAIRTWYLQNQTQITWFIVGWLGLSMLSSLANGEFVSATISGVLITLNIALNK